MEEKIKDLLKELRLNESMISTLLGVAVVLVVGVLLYNYFSSQPTTQTPDFEFDLEDLEGDTPVPVEPGEVEEGETPNLLPKTHKVSKGEHLWKIAEIYYGSGYNWVDIAQANELIDGDSIESEMSLTIPDIPARLQTVVEGSLSVEVTQPETKVIAKDTYVVQAGDSLWSIAVRAYSDGYQWSKLYEANQEVIGSNPDQVEKGIELSIPR